MGYKWKTGINKKKREQWETNVGSGIRTSTSKKKQNSHQDTSFSEVMAQILGHMGLHMKSIRTNDNQLPKSVSTDKVGPQQIIRLKGWCELYTRLIETIPEIWNELDKKQNKEDRLDRLIRDFSQEEREDDTVDIHIDDRMGTCIVKGRFVATLEYNYSTYHHGLTTFATSLRGVEESTE